MQESSDCCHHININTTEFMYLMLSTWRSIWIKGEVQKGRHSSSIEADICSLSYSKKEKRGFLVAVARWKIDLRFSKVYMGVCIHLYLISMKLGCFTHIDSFKSLSSQQQWKNWVCSFAWSPQRAVLTNSWQHSSQAQLWSLYSVKPCIVF